MFFLVEVRVEYTQPKEHRTHSITMATPVRSDNPAVLCKSTKELLCEDGMKEVDDCPICRDDYGILCRVARHVPPTATGKISPDIIILSSSF